MTTDPTTPSQDFAGDVAGAVAGWADRLAPVVFTLDPADALVLLLAVVDGLTVVQIAATVGEPAPVVQGRLAYGMRRLGWRLTVVPDRG